MYNILINSRKAAQCIYIYKTHSLVFIDTPQPSLSVVLVLLSCPIVVQQATWPVSCCHVSSLVMKGPSSS